MYKIVSLQYRVQFNDTLTSTFEYPSETSLIIDDSFSAVDGGEYGQSVDDFAARSLSDQQQNFSPIGSHHQHHHVAVDEIIQLSTTPSTLDSSASIATKNTLGTLPLGECPFPSKHLISSMTITNYIVVYIYYLLFM